MLKKLLLELLLLTVGVPANGESIFGDGFEVPVPIDHCDHPLVSPEGFALKTKSWVDAFSTPGTTNAVYPNSVGSPVPVPGYEWFRRYQSGQYQFYTKGQIVAIPFVALPETTVDMTWDTAQAGPNYGTPRPADAMFVGISPCAWDLRSDPKCSRMSGLDSLFYTTREGSGSVCKLDPGGTYYINVVMADPQNSLLPTCSTSSPNSADGCDVQMRHTGY